MGDWDFRDTLKVVGVACMAAGLTMLVRCDELRDTREESQATTRASLASSSTTVALRPAYAGAAIHSDASSGTRASRMDDLIARPSVDRMSVDRTAGAPARLEAIFELADAAGDQAVPTLAAAALSDGSPTVRQEAVYVLGEIGGETGMQALEQALLDRDVGVREAAVEALVDRGGERAALALAVALRDRNASLRAEAVEALGEIGGEAAIRLLRQACADEVAAVREAAADLLAELQHSPP